MRDERFEWYDRKAATNRRDHGVTFEVARQAFDDPLGLDEPDEPADDDTDQDPEDRWQWTGRLGNGRILFVIYTMRTGRDRRTRTRIISARKATTDEQARYEDNAARQLRR